MGLTLSCNDARFDSLGNAGEQPSDGGNIRQFSPLTSHLLKSGGILFISIYAATVPKLWGVLRGNAPRGVSNQLGRNYERIMKSTPILAYFLSYTEIIYKAIGSEVKKRNAETRSQTE